jgi:hypothetical protein
MLPKLARTSGTTEWLSGGIAGRDQCFDAITSLSEVREERQRLQTASTLPGLTHRLGSRSGIERVGLLFDRHEGSGTFGCQCSAVSCLTRATAPS